MPDVDDTETQILSGDMLEAKLWENEDPHVFTTNPDDPDEGRTFVWVSTGWFERIEAEDGDGGVEFSPLSMDEHALREWLSEQNLEITEIDDDYAEDVREELLADEPLYMEAPELSNQEVDTRP
ncbi:MAG: hypothetical protein ABI559_11680 [Chloroflexota bacterium]